MEQIKAFMSKAKTDSELYERLKALVTQEGSTSGIVELAAEHGFIFTEEDMTAAKRGGGESRELSEEELDKVSGGWTFNNYDEDKCKGLKTIRDDGRCTGVYELFWMCDHFSSPILVGIQTVLRYTMSGFIVAIRTVSLLTMSVY